MCNALEELKLEGKQEGIEEGTVYFLVVPFDDRFLFPCDYFRWSNLPGGELFAVSLVRFQCPRKKESFILKYFFYFTVMFLCVGIIINSYQQKPSPIMKF